MKDKGNVKIKGIKCDNPKCSYRDNSVEFDDYPNWVNKPCPLCGCNLLTEKDYKFCKRLVFIGNLLPASGNKSKSKISFQLHGKGADEMEVEVREYDN